MSLARKMANTPTMLSITWSLTRQENGEQAYWAVIALAAMLGQMGKPGARCWIWLHCQQLPWKQRKATAFRSITARQKQS